MNSQFKSSSVDILNLGQMTLKSIVDFDDTFFSV